jgi:cytochrome c oxidase subunit 3
MGLFFLFIASVAGMWLWRQGVLQSPWLEEGEATQYPSPRPLGAPPPSATKVGLIVFLAVAGCLFSLLTASFFMRMDSPDWQMPPTPPVLWFNTAVLIASSVTLHFALVGAKRGDMAELRKMLVAAGACTIVFVLGQIWAWRDLLDGGYFVSSNAANAFFYLLTGAHALHVLGGLVALGRTGARAFEAPRVSFTLPGSVELCAIYWHFLLFIWLVMFALLTGWADNIGVICRRLLS